MALLDDLAPVGQRTVTGIAPKPIVPVAPAPTAQQWTSQAPPTQPPPDRAQPLWAVEDRRTYQQAKQQILSAIAPLQRAAQTYSAYGRLAQQRGGYERGSYANPATEAYARTQFEQAVPRKYEGANLLNPYELARADIPDVIRKPVVRGVAEAQRINPAFGAITNSLDLLEFAGVPILSGSSIRNQMAEMAVPREVWEVAVELSPFGTVGDVQKAAREGTAEALTALRRATESEDGQRIIRRLMSETGAVGGKGDPEDLIGAGARAAGDVVDDTSPSTVSTSPPSPVRRDFGVKAEQEIKDSILQRIRRNAPIREAQEEVRHGERIERSIKVEEALRSNLSPEETFRAVNAARAGQYHASEHFEKVDFTPGELAWMMDKIATAKWLRGKGLSQGAVLDSIQRMREGKGLRKFEEEMWRKTFGDEFVVALKERGVDDMLANLARAWDVGGNPSTQSEIARTGGRYFTESVQERIDRQVARALEAAQKRGERLSKKQMENLRRSIEQSVATPRNLGPMEPEIAMLNDKFYAPAVQKRIDNEVRTMLDKIKRTGRGAFGIATKESDLEKGIEQAMDVPARLGPLEQARVISPGAAATTRAVDEVAMADINAAMLKYQMDKGAIPEWKYAEDVTKQALKSDDPMQELTRIQKALTPVQVWRSFVTAFDNSFLGRQGWKMIASNPVEWARAYKRSWQALLSEDAAAVARWEVENAPNFALGQRLKRPLVIYEQGGGPNAAEEFLSPVTSKIPLLNRSERAYVTAGNWLRQMSLERDIRTWEKHFGPITDGAAQRLVDNINNATMAGNISALGTNQSALSQTFFSIRAKASLGQFLADGIRAVGPNTDPVVRGIIAKRIAGWLTLNSSLLATAAYAGSQTGLVSADLDPWSPKFGKIKAGGQTYDVWGGYAPIVRLILQAGSGNENAVGNYTRNQFSPAAGVGYDLSFGRWKTYDNKKLSLKEPGAFGLYALQRTTPIMFTDIYKAWKEDGFVGTVIPAAAAFSGIGVGENFGQNEAQEKKAEKSKVLEEIGLGEFDDKAYITDTKRYSLGGKMQTWSDFLSSNVQGWDLGFDADEIMKFSEGYEYTSSDGSKKTATGLAAIQHAFIDDAVADGDYPDTELGRAQAERDFGRYPQVKQLEKAQEVDLRRHWEAYPEDLLKAIQSGTVETSIEKEKILEEAGLLP